MNIDNTGLAFLESLAEGWIGLKNKVSYGSMFNEVLKRQVPQDMPEADLMCAVLVQAAEDSVMDIRRAAVRERNTPVVDDYESKVRINQDAIDFFKDGRSDVVCDALGIERSFLNDLYWRFLSVESPCAIC